MTEPINFFQQVAAKRAQSSGLQASPEEVQRMISAVTAIELAISHYPINTGEMFISCLVAKCPVCEHEEIIEMPTEASEPEEIVSLIMLARAMCPECEERARNAIAMQELEEYQIGLEALDGTEDNI